ncbi:hypothetical protein HYV56_01445 [Candidatus Peregrinibacteria bacterium]|nr:hypothetical protein [Candidatus Peregrinibacteria bacterium]
MKKTCKNCQNIFGIEKSDLAFYEKISPSFEGRKYLIPPPTLCQNCRQQRKLAWRNELKFYKRPCDFTKKNIISIYAPDTEFTVYSPEIWWSDKWDALEYGQNFDFNKTFFEQFAELLKKVPRPSLFSEQSENCEYTHNTVFSKNCYLSSCCRHGEDCLYNYMVASCKNVADCLSLFNCELMYFCINCKNCYSGIYLQNCEGCIESAFCFDCRSVKNCFGCVGLENKEYHVFNKKVSKEEFEKYRASLSSYQIFEKAKKKFPDFLLKFHHRFAKLVGTENCTGDHLYFSKNCIHCFDSENCEDLKYCNHAANTKDSMDVFGLFMGGELQYETSAAGGGINVQFAYFSWHNIDSQYINYCQSSKNIFGCIGLKHKKYCILNKQYKKEEYEKLMPRIIDHMTRTKEWGEFFPVTISPYAYNESMAVDYYPLTKEEVLNRGFRWKEEITKEYLKQNYEIPDDIKKVPEIITNEILACTECLKNFRITVQELKFYQKMGIPIPRTCNECRHSHRMKLRNPRKLWKRTCQKCGKKIETSYSPNRPEIIYCEECYINRE